MPAWQLRGARRVRPRIAACIWKEVHDEEQTQEGSEETAQEKGQVSTALGILRALAAAPSAPFFFFSRLRKNSKPRHCEAPGAPGNLSRWQYLDILQLGLVHPEIMSQFVEDCLSDLVTDFGFIGADLLDVLLVEDDAVWPSG